jgi:DNA ligase (NAD+)
MDIDGLGEKIVDQLVDSGLVKDFADLYHLKVETLSHLERLAEKSAANLVQAIQATQERRLPSLLFGLGVRYVGEHVAKVLASHYRSLDALARANWEELMQVPGIGPRIAESAANFFAQEENQRVIARLRAAGVRMEEEEAQVPASLPLEGKIFALTGALEGFSREEAKEDILQRGGKIASSVSRKTDYVVAGKDPGSKLQEAQRLGVRILDQQEFQDLLTRE